MKGNQIPSAHEAVSEILDMLESVHKCLGDGSGITPERIEAVRAWVRRERCADFNTGG